jgi:hypothetical protein
MHTLACSRVLLVVGLSCILFSGRPAAAQKAPEVGKADALFNAGRSLLEAGEYADACPKFAEAQTLAPGLGVTLYLADCYERLGRTHSALMEFKRAAQIASSRGDKRGAIAADRAAALESRVPLLSIAVSPGARAQGVTVTRDGEPVPASEWDTPVPMNPGKHEIVASAPSKMPSHTTVELAPRKATITTMVDPLETPAEPLPPAPVIEIQALAPVPQTRKWAGLVLGGTGIVGIGVGAVLGTIAISKLHESNEGPCNASDQCTTPGMGLRSQAEGFGNASTIAFVVGGVALASGAVLYLTAPKEGKRSEGLRVRPLVSPSLAGLEVGSSF